MKHYLFFIVFVSTLFICSCTDDDNGNNDSSTFQNGMFISNEGGFNVDLATVDFYHFDGDSISKGIFAAANGRPLGDVAQSTTVIGDKAYIVVNNSNKVEVVNVSDFTEVATITGLEFPRYVLGIGNDKAYISQWGADGVSGSIQILDLVSNSITASIDIPGNGPEEMLLQGDKVYVSYAGGYSVDNQITVIDITTNEVETITTYDNPTSIALGNTGNIWVLSAGAYDFVSMTSSAAYLSEYSGTDYSELKSFELPYSSPSDLHLSGDGSKLYFISNSSIVSASANASTLEMETIREDASFYSLGYDADNQRLYGGDAADFASNGMLRIYNESGVLQNTASTGIIPGHFTLSE